MSIILRSYNEGWALRDTLPAIAAQNHKLWELIVIDSGSTDGSVELLRRFRLRHLVQLPHHDYTPARVMNRGMELASSDYGIFLNADATPQGAQWLKPLVAALLGQGIAAAFGRQIPRLDCKAVFARDYERCFGPNRKSAQWHHFFSMASSGVRKDVWAKRRFNSRMSYSEDDEWTRWCRAQGYRVVYVPESVVMHSHNYTASQTYERNFGEGCALAAVWSSPDRKPTWLRNVLFGWMNDARRDLLFCARARRLCEWPHALRIRWQQRSGRLAGFRDGWIAYRQLQDPSLIAPPVWATDPQP